MTGLEIIIEWAPAPDLRYHTISERYCPHTLQRKFIAKTDDGLFGELWVDVNPENTFERLEL